MKTILSRSRILEEKIVQYHVGLAFFTNSIQDWKISLCFARVVGRSFPSRGWFILRHRIYIGNSNLLVMIRSLNTSTIVAPHFSIAEISCQNSWYGWKTICFSAWKAGKRPLFSETLAGISISTQWTPCYIFPLLFLSQSLPLLFALPIYGCHFLLSFDHSVCTSLMQQFSYMGIPALPHPLPQHLAFWPIFIYQ